jgi:hypothetical protein
MTSLTPVWYGCGCGCGEAREQNSPPVPRTEIAPRYPMRRHDPFSPLFGAGTNQPVVL